MVPLLRHLLRCDRGSGLVELALVLPMMVMLFATVVEGGRMMWSYQTATAGVRDAARFLGRAVPTDVCAVGRSFPDYNSTLLRIVRDSVTTGASVMPQDVTVNAVSSSLVCVTGSYRVSPAPVATVTAQVTIEFPFAALFEILGADLGQVTTTITDRTRVFGA